MTPAVEHYCTLFNSNFLPMGLSLHSSLLRHAQPFHLWILCMDEAVEQQLRLLDLPHVTLIPLREFETPELRSVRPTRSTLEYCWTCTPFTISAVFERCPSARRVTYLDADLFFFSSPSPLLDELEASGRDVLLTEHAFAPQYRHFAKTHGRFCVQFLTFQNTPAAQRVCRWWQERCLEWCYARFEEGRFGDQLYLDAMPELFLPNVHISYQPELTLGPWNVYHFEHTLGEAMRPIFYHFSGFRLVGPRWARLYIGYRVGSRGRSFYKAYLRELAASLRTLSRVGIPLTIQRPPEERYGLLRYLKRTFISRSASYTWLPSDP